MAALEQESTLDTELEDGTRASSGKGASCSNSRGAAPAVQYSIVNFYHLTDVEHPFQAGLLLLHATATPGHAAHNSMCRMWHRRTILQKET